MLKMFENKVSSGIKQAACGVAVALEAKETVTTRADACEV